MIIKGKVWKFGDDISTDLIAPGQYFHLRSNLKKLAEHVLEGADPEFAKEAKKYNFVAGGRNFGLGSSREHAPAIIKLAGIRAVLAKSFARIFYRNAINIGLPVLICDTDKICQGNDLEVVLSEGKIINHTLGIEITTNALTEVAMKILADGGLVKHIKENDGFALCSKTK